MCAKVQQQKKLETIKEEIDKIKHHEEWHRYVRLHELTDMYRRV